MVEWLKVAGFEHQYEVSSSGKVRNSKTLRILQPGLTANGYHIVVLRRDLKSHTLYVHRVVGTTFGLLENTELIINHKDGVKTNNNLDNLEPCSFAENMKHAQDTGLLNIVKGSRNGKSKLNESEVKEIKALIKAKYKLKLIAVSFGVTPEAISAIKRGISWSNI